MSRSHWFSCDDCMVRWAVGANLMSSWQYETQAEWERNAEDLIAFMEAQFKLKEDVDAHDEL